MAPNGNIPRAFLCIRRRGCIGQYFYVQAVSPSEEGMMINADHHKSVVQYSVGLIFPSLMGLSVAVARIFSGIGSTRNM